MKGLILVLTLIWSITANSAVFIFGSGEATNLTDKIGFSANDQKIISNETANPSSGGYTAGEGSLLLRDNSNTGELWLKLLSTDTDWVRMLYAGDNGSELLGFTYKQFNTESYAEHGSISNFNTGNNATFDGGGSIAGTLAKITSSLIDTTDTANYQFTQAAGSLNDYFTFKQFEIDNGVGVGIRFKYQYDGSDDDLEVELKCMTSTTVYSLGTLEAASTTKVFSEYFFVPSGCGDVRIGISTAVLNSGSILKFNRWTMSDDPGTFKNLFNTTEWESYTPTFQGLGTPTNVDFKWRRLGENLEIRGTMNLGTTTAVEARIGFPTGLTSVSTIPTLEVAGRGSILAASSAYFTTGILSEPSVTYFTMGAQSSTGGEISKRNGNYWNTNELMTVAATVQIDGWRAESEHYVTPAKAGSQTYRIEQTGDAFTNRAGEVEYNLSTATIENGTVFGEFIQAVDDSGNTRTKFVATKSCTLDISWTVQGDTINARPTIYLNDSIYKKGTQLAAANTYGEVTALGIPMEKDEYVTLGMDVGNIRNLSTNITYMTFEARPKEATFLAAIPANTFSARISNNGSTATITSQGNSIGSIETIVSTATRSATGVVDLVWTRTLDKIPAVLPVVEATSIRMCRTESVSTTGAQIRCFSTTANSDQNFSISIHLQR